VAAGRKEITPEQYLALERRAETRSEYLRGETFAMSGASLEHILIAGNLAAETRNQLKTGSCLVLSSDMRVKVDATGFYTYSDTVIVCVEPRLEDDHFDTLLNPLVIVEVLSDSTEKYDRDAKFGHYRQIPSLREYVLVSQDRAQLDRYVREPDEAWKLVVFADSGGTFSFGTIPVHIPMAEIYRGVKLHASV
jgi:Uma2 family endonuclease